MNIISDLAKVVYEILDEEGQTVDLTPETSLRDDLGLDSLQLAQLTVEIEDQYDVDVFEDGMVETIGDILKKIQGAE
jgi:acyl carrier protein